MIKKLRCGECGSRNIKPTNVKGSFFPHKQYSKVLLTVDLVLNVCVDCDNQIHIGGDGVKIDIALEESISQGAYTEI